jgi:hypothetical protein
LDYDNRDESPGGNCDHTTGEPSYSHIVAGLALGRMVTPKWFAAPRAG